MKPAQVIVLGENVSSHALAKKLLELPNSVACIQDDYAIDNARSIAFFVNTERGDIATSFVLITNERLDDINERNIWI